MLRLLFIIILFGAVSPQYDLYPFSNENIRAVEMSVRRAGDFNGDGTVNTEDIRRFTACQSGPSIAYDRTHCFAGMDLDHDGDIDQSDFGLLQALYGH
jgi:hypothetical protein